MVNLFLWKRIDIVMDRSGDSGRWNSVEGYPRPVVTVVLMAINLALFWLMELGGGSERSSVLELFGAQDRALVWQGDYYRLLSAMFLHIGYVHILSNLLALYLLGSIIEPFYGPRRFILIYLLSGLAGNAVSQLFLDGLSAGASGAILGLSGALLSRVSAIKGHVPEQSRRFFFFVLLFLIGLDVVLGFTMTHVNNAAHVGGLIGGYWLSYAMVQRASARRWKRRWGTVAAGLFGLAFAGTLLAGFFPLWDARYLLAQANVLLRQNKIERAVPYIERALERDPKIRRPYYKILAQYYYLAEQPEKALRYGRRAAAGDPGDANIHEWLERSYERLGQSRAADQERKTVLRLRAQMVALHPGSAVHLNNLSYALAERRLLLDQALDLALEANELTGSRDPIYIDTLAWVLYQMGRYEEAARLMRPVAKAFDEPVYDYHLGAILIARGETEQGRKAIERAIADGLDWWNRRDAERLLHRLKPTA